MLQPFVAENKPSTVPTSGEFEKCQISKAISWNLCYVEKDSTEGSSRKDEECRVGDLVDHGVAVTFDCWYCLCSDGIFDCKKKVGEFRESFDSCALLNCTEERDPVVQNPDPCSCPGAAPKPPSPPKCECECPPKNTSTTPQSTTGQTVASSTTQTSTFCPTSAPPSPPPTQQSPCSLVTMNYTLVDELPEGNCLRNEVIPVTVCTGSCRTKFEFLQDHSSQPIPLTPLCSCCQATEVVERQVTVSCPGFEVDVLVTEATSCDCKHTGCLQ